MPEIPGINPDKSIQPQPSTTTKINTGRLSRADNISGMRQTNSQPGFSVRAAKASHQDDPQTLQAFKEIYQEIYEELKASGNLHGLERYPPENMEKIADIIAALNHGRTEYDSSGKPRGAIAPTIKNHQELQKHCEIRTNKHGHEYMALKNNQTMADEITGVHTSDDAINVMTDFSRASDDQRETIAARAQTATTDSSTVQNTHSADREGTGPKLFKDQLQRVNATAKPIPEQPTTTGKKIKAFLMTLFLPGFTPSKILLEGREIIPILQEYNTAVTTAIDEIRKHYEDKTPAEVDEKITAFKKQLLTQKESREMLWQAERIFRPVSEGNYGILSKMKESGSVDAALLGLAILTFPVAGIGVVVGAFSLITIAARMAMKYFRASAEQKQVMALHQEYEAITGNISTGKTD